MLLILLLLLILLVCAGGYTRGPGPYRTGGISLFWLAVVVLLILWFAGAL